MVLEALSEKPLKQKEKKLLEGELERAEKYFEKEEKETNEKSS